MSKSQANEKKKKKRETRSPFSFPSRTRVKRRNNKCVSLFCNLTFNIMKSQTRWRRSCSFSFHFKTTNFSGTFGIIKMSSGVMPYFLKNTDMTSFWIGFFSSPLSSRSSVRLKTTRMRAKVKTRTSAGNIIAQVKNKLADAISNSGMGRMQDWRKLIWIQLSLPPPTHTNSWSIIDPNDSSTT